MNAKQAKQIPLDDILSVLGYQPAKEIDGELWYQSPFRHEREASFKINREKNIWYDFGGGFGGNVVDFILVFYNMTSVSKALKQLEALQGSPRKPIQETVASSPRIAKPQAKPKKKPTIKTIQSLQNKALLQYLQKRGISQETAAPYVKEIYYTLSGKRYFALAFPNLSGGYELRNPYFKGSIGKKDISLLMKRKEKKRTAEKRESLAVTIFEGFIDFLSALSFYRKKAAKTPVIILNSVSLTDRAMQKIQELDFQKVYLYLDRDSSGRRITDHFKKQVSSGILIIDKSNLYADYKDFNEFLVQTQSVKVSH